MGRQSGEANTEQEHHEAAEAEADATKEEQGDGKGDDNLQAVRNS
jgi:hypothetical protein